MEAEKKPPGLPAVFRVFVAASSVGHSCAGDQREFKMPKIKASVLHAYECSTLQ
jgi:hypothetical protein